MAKRYNKWNTEKLNKLLEDIIIWHFDNPEKYSFYAYFADKKEIYKNIRFENIYDIMKRHGDEESESLMSKIKAIQEEKILENSLGNLWNSNFGKFVLNTSFQGYVTKDQQELKVSDNRISFNFGNDIETNDGE